MIQNKNSLSTNALVSSFRDPDNQVFKLGDHIYRKISETGIDNYQKFVQSGLSEKLQLLGYVIPHTEVTSDFALNSKDQIIVQPKKIPFISYGYEWCFSQLKDAALLTLQVAKLALEYGMVLKDASCYNIQFYRGKPIFIDIGSFSIYQEGKPWMAYRQFCQHFLAPLALIAKKDVRLGLLTKLYIDGIPLDLASSLLPFKSKLSFSLFIHLHLHAKFQQKFAEATRVPNTKQSMSKIAILALLDNLSTLISRLTWSPIKSEWSHYYSQTNNYTDIAREHKTFIIKQLVEKIKPQTVWDLGGNNGFYSRVIIEQGVNVVCFDNDPMAVEANYRQAKEQQCVSMLPLIQDFTNPSSAMGWAGVERDGLNERSSADLIVGLALIHHLAISNNVPLKLIAKYFSSLGDYLIIEFVPKEDSQVQVLLANREDIFYHYDIDSFRYVFSSYYVLLEEIPIKETCRTIFLMKRING